jgi:hypothetical protein
LRCEQFRNNSRIWPAPDEYRRSLPAKWGSTPTVPYSTLVGELFRNRYNHFGYRKPRALDIAGAAAHVRWPKRLLCGLALR